MASSETSGIELRSLVHTAGPVEREPDDSPLGFLLVQRCLRCDELLACWRTARPPRTAFRVGRLVAADAYDGIFAHRYPIVDRDLAKGERVCEPVPAEFL